VVADDITSPHGMIARSRRIATQRQYHLLGEAMLQPEMTGTFMVGTGLRTKRSGQSRRPRSKPAFN
jgi:hypothetical protein